MQNNQRKFEEPKIDENVEKENEKYLNDNARDVIASIKDHLSKLDIEKGLANKYVQLVSQMENLDKSIVSFGKNQLTLEDRDKLLKEYQSVATKIEDIVKEDPETENEKTLFDHVNNLSKYVSSDIRSMVKMDKPQTISEISQNGRKRVIDITNQEIQRVGANLSDRQVIKDGNEKKVFTKNEDFDLVKTFKDNMDKFCNQYPDYAKYFKKFDNLNMVYRAVDVGVANNECDCPLTSEFFEQINREYNLSSKDEKEINNLLETDEIGQRVMHDFLDSMFKIQNQASFNKVVGNGKGEPVAERNSAMSVVAELLGVGKTICHSEPVIIKDGDKEIEGNMMDFSDGIDPGALDNNDPIAKYNMDEITVTKEAKKQIADVQVLDYICGNLDRHGSNLFLKFDTKDPSDPKLVGVEGIDNDASFFTADNIDKVKGYNRMVGLGNLQLMDKETADRIKLISPAMLKLSLQGMKISDKAIEKTVERFKYLQIALEKQSKEVNKDSEIDYKKQVTSLSDVRINIVNGDEAWKDISLKRMTNEFARYHSENLFTQTYTMMDGEENLRYDEQAREKVYKSRMDLAKERKQSQKNIKDKINILDKATQRFRTSKQYIDVQKALKNVQKAEKNLKFTSDAKAYDKYKDALKNLKSKSEEYLARKESQKQAGATFKKYTQNRIEKVTEIKDMIDARLEAYNVKLDKLQEKENYFEERKEKVQNFKAEKDARLLAEQQKYFEEQQKIIEAQEKEAQKQIQDQINKEIKSKDNPPSKKTEVEKVAEKSIDKATEKADDENIRSAM